MRREPGALSDREGVATAIQRHEVLHQGAVLSQSLNERYNPDKPVLSGDAFFFRHYPTPHWLSTCSHCSNASAVGCLYVGDKCQATSYQIHKVGADYKTPIMSGDTVFLKAHQVVPEQQHFWAFVGVDGEGEPALDLANAANPNRLLSVPHEHVWTIFTLRDEGIRNILVEDKVRFVKTCMSFEECDNDCLAVDHDADDTPVYEAQQVCKAESGLTLMQEDPEDDKTRWELKASMDASCTPAED
jgi:hypothetical protein